MLDVTYQHRSKPFAIFARENSLATIVGEPTAGRLLSATSVKVGRGYRLALPTGAYYTWKGSVHEGTPIAPDEAIEFNWQERRVGIDVQLQGAIRLLRRDRPLRAVVKFLNYRIV